MGSDWQKRSDITYSIEVYHIDDEIKSSNTIVVHFKIELLSVGYDSQSIANQLQTFIQDAFTKQSKNHKLFVTVEFEFVRKKHTGIYKCAQNVDLPILYTH